MQTNSALEIDLSIPADEISLGFDKDGLPRSEPVEPKAVEEKKPDDPPRITQDDLDSARWQADQIAKERDKLAKEVQTAREAHGATERELGTRTSQAIRAHMHAVSSEHQQFVNALSAVKLEAETAKRELQMAMADEGIDGAERGRRVADAQERMSLAAADMRTLEQAKIGAEQRLEEAKRTVEKLAPDGSPPARQEAKREVEPEIKQTPDQWIGQFPPPTQRWLNEHKDYVTDLKLNRKLIRFADEFMDDFGEKNLHTSQFIEALNGKFFPKPAKETETVSKEEDGVEVETEAAPQRRQSAPAAPVRGSNSHGGKPSNMQGKVRLSAQEQNAAIGMFPKLSQQEALHKYAQFVKRLEQDGISRDLPNY